MRGDLKFQSNIYEIIQKAEQFIPISRYGESKYAIIYLPYHNNKKEKLSANNTIKHFWLYRKACI